jgi:hypothetical protein
MSWRNRIVGGIAIAVGLIVVVLLGIDAHWDSHDTIKPLKALFGGIAFVALGAWYLIRGAKAESWRDTEAPLGPNVLSKTEGPDINSVIADLERLPSFQAECRKVEAEMREKAAEKERAIESKFKGKA